MKPLISAVFLMLAAPSWSAPEQPAETSAQSEASQNKPAPQLIALERQLFERQESRDKGTLLPEQYQTFVSRFRLDLESAMRRAVISTPGSPDVLRRLSGKLNEFTMDV